MGRYLCETWQGVRFVASILRLIVIDGKKYDLLPAICACQRWEEVWFVATNVDLIIKDGEKYDLLAPIGV